MDTEQVISNPYQELQTDAVDSGKKTTLTERLTAVRNNVCEHNLRTETSHLEKQRTHTLRNLHMDTSNLRHQVKVMDIDKRKNELTMQQRIDPEKDFSYDKRQINNSAKRLGITSEESFYLDKKLQYPLRTNILKDHNKKTIIKKARRTLADHTLRKKTDQYDMDNNQTSQMNERSTTAHTLSTIVDISSPEPNMKEQSSTQMTPIHLQRRGSKSAPQLNFSKSEPQHSTSRQTDINHTDAKLPLITAQSKSRVKFQVKPQLRQLYKLSKANTLYSGMQFPVSNYKQSWDSDSDDDYVICEKVDLRALFFGNKSQNSDSKNAVSGNTTPRTVPTRMSSDLTIPLRCSVAKPKINEEILIKETKAIRDKIARFLGTMKMAEKVPEKDKIEEVKEKEKTKIYEKTTASKAAILQQVFAKPIDHSKTWGYTPGEPKSKSDKKEIETIQVEIEKPKSANEDKSVKVKNMWELIRTNVQNGTVNKKYTANDLLLQQLTGILVQADRKCLIPVHAASRALRHTPTFKMRRVVEELTRQRTRYEQQEVEKLQKQDTQMESGMYQDIAGGDDSGVQHYPPRAWGTPSRELEQPS